MNLYQKLYVRLDISRPGFQSTLLHLIENTEGWTLRKDLHDNFSLKAVLKDREVICVQTPVYNYDGKEIQGVIWTYDFGDRLESFNIIPTIGNRLLPEAYNYLLNQFVDVFVRRTAADYGATIDMSKPILDMKDYIGDDGLEVLTMFSDWANKSTGNSHPLDFERWCDFLLICFNKKIMISSDLLEGWLMEHGWSAEMASELALDYEYGMNLLNYEHNRR